MKNVFLKLENSYYQDKFQKIEINCFELTHPNQFYQVFYNNIFEKKENEEKSRSLLEDYFEAMDPKDKFIVLLVDELDRLHTKDCQILYHLFDWAARPGSSLLVLSIANKMDLPETLPPKIISRMGCRRIPFHAYKFSELVEIFNYRLGELKVIFEEDGISLIARKVASLSGDARRFLDICIRALNIAKQQLGTNSDKAKSELTVTLNHASCAVNEVFSNDKVIAIPNCANQEKVLLDALKQELQSNNKDEVLFSEVYAQHCANCRFNGRYVPTVTELDEIANNLFAKRLILIEYNNSALKHKIKLNVSTDELDRFLGIF